jgi:hypothetical protein
MAQVLVLGFFNKSDIEEADQYGTGPCAAFQEAAEHLRGYATFVVGGFSLMREFGVKSRPAVVFVGDGESGGEHWLLVTVSKLIGVCVHVHILERQVMTLVVVTFGSNG